MGALCARAVRAHPRACERGGRRAPAPAVPARSRRTDSPRCALHEYASGASGARCVSPTRSRPAGGERRAAAGRAGAPVAVLVVRREIEALRPTRPHGADLSAMISVAYTPCQHRAASAGWRWESGGLNTANETVEILGGCNAVRATCEASTAGVARGRVACPKQMPAITDVSQ